MLYGVEVSFIDITKDISAEISAESALEKIPSEQILSIPKNIANRQQRSITLFESEQRLKLATEASGIGMWFWDLVEDLEFTPKCKALFGLPPEQKVSYEIFLNILYSEDRNPTESAINEALANQTDYRVEYRVVWSDGSVRWIVAKGRGLYNQNSEPVSMMGTVQDISDRKKIEKALQQQTEDLIQANQLKDEFLAIVSHELRTPLNPILGWSQLLSRGSLNADKIAQGIGIIERNAKLQVQLIDDLLDVSRILRGQLNLKKSPLNLESVIRFALVTVQLAAEAKSIQIETIFEPSVGVLGDAGRLQQVVWNLVSNAIKFTPEGGKVIVTLERYEQYALIQVKDTGNGIEAEFLPYVFERFRQAQSSSTREFGGLGLGLAIVRNLTGLHGGTVAVASPGLGQGAIFSVKLPLINTLTVEPIEIDNNSNRTVQPNRFSDIKVLAIDDEADSLDILTMVLEYEGAEVVSVTSAQSALEVFNELTPDLIISDIGMPETDGYALITQIRELPQGKDIPAIALTAYASNSDQQRSMDAGFQKHISKPINIPELVNAIVQLIE